MDKRQKLMILLFACVICFIWGNSMLSPRASAAISGFVREALIKVFGGSDGNDSAIAVFSVRKIAHFVEFTAFGIVSSLLLHTVVSDKKYRWTMLALLGFFVPIMDETIQLFNNRGPSVRDVWLDVCGYVTGVSAVLLTRLVCLQIEDHRKKQTKK